MTLRISLEDVIAKLELKTLVTIDGPMPDICVSDLNRPGIELAGYFNYFAHDRIQVLGKAEISFLEELSREVRQGRLEEFMAYDIPCVIITRNLKPPREILDLAAKHRRMVLGTSVPTTLFMSRLTSFLESELAPKTSLHGVLMDIYGVGVLIMGESGIGKSETAIELIKR
jgi:HPr kinase/phosphorylase